MTVDAAAVVEAARWLATRLAAGSLEGAAIIAAVALICWRFTSLPASFQALLWWVASLKLVLAFVALPAIPLPVLPARAPAQLELQLEMPVVAPVPETQVAARPVSVAAPPSFVDVSLRETVWLLLAGIWLAAIAWHATRVLRSMREFRRICRQARPADASIALEARELARDLGVRRMPAVLVSPDVDTPQAVGIRKSAVLLPETFDRLSDAERRMALAHELVHVRRRDVLTGMVPALAERLFFFHPLARLAAREYVLAREAACDAAVLSGLRVAPEEYARLLLRLGVVRRRMAWSAGGSSSSATLLKRRLNMLGHTAAMGSTRRMAIIPAIVVVLAALPYQLVAQPGDAPARSVHEHADTRLDLPVAVPRTEGRGEFGVRGLAAGQDAGASQENTAAAGSERQAEQVRVLRERFELAAPVRARVKQEAARAAAVRAMAAMIAEQSAARQAQAAEQAGAEPAPERASRARTRDMLTNSLRDVEAAVERLRARAAQRGNAEPGAADLRELERSLTQLREQLLGMQAGIDVLNTERQSTRNALEQQLAELQAQRDVRQRQMEELRAQLAQFQDMQRALQDESRALERRIEALRRELEGAK